MEYGSVKLNDLGNYTTNRYCYVIEYFSLQENFPYLQSQAKKKNHTLNIFHIWSPLTTNLNLLHWIVK